MNDSTNESSKRDETESSPYQDTSAGLEQTSVQDTSPVPPPVFKRVILLWASGVGVLILGMALSIGMRDPIQMALSAVLGVWLISYGVLLWRRVTGRSKSGGLYVYRGICVEHVPKIRGHYIENSFYNTEGGINGTEWKIVMPRKVQFKIGHEYICYFDKNIMAQQGTELWTDKPTEGFLAKEDLGIYTDTTKLKEDLAVPQDTVSI